MAYIRLDTESVTIIKVLKMALQTGVFLNVVTESVTNCYGNSYRKNKYNSPFIDWFDNE